MTSSSSLVRRMAVALVIGALAGVSTGQVKQYPGRHGMIDVTKWMKPPYNLTAYRALIDSALGSGGTALATKVIYFPAGTYVMDDSIQMEGITDLGCCTQFWGQGPGQTVIKLKDNAPKYTNASSPKAFILTPPGNMSFRYCLYDLTVEIGAGNNGAMAVDYIANNRGSIENVSIVSADKNALVGLEMTRYGPGPCLIKNVTVDGFTIGVRVGSGEYSPTFEGITVLNQKTAGFRNQGNYIPIRGLTSTNTVSALSVTGGTVLLVDANLQTPSGQTSTSSAIDNSGGTVYLRNISSTGYASALKNRGTVVQGNSVTEYFSGTTFYTLFGDQKASLKLPIKTAPEFHDNDTTKWVCIQDHLEYFAASLQLALTYAAANGKTTVYAPYLKAGQLAYSMYGTAVNVPPQVKKIQGFEARLAPVGGARIRLNITGNTTDPLIIESMAFSGVTVNCQSPRPVVFEHCEIDSITNTSGCGELFVEDMSSFMNLQNPQRVWLRQWNPEDMGPTPRTRMLNLGGQAWILGVKIEGGGTVVDVRSGGSVELLGSLLYPTGGPAAGSAEWQKPAFIINESCASLMYTVHIYSGPWYQYDVSETRGGVTRYLCRSSSTNCTANVGGNWDIPLVVANKGCSQLPDPVLPEVQPGARPVSTPRSDLVSLGGRSPSVTLPAGVRGFALFTVRGEKVWGFDRTTGEEIRVTVPQRVREVRVAVVKFIAD